VSNYLYPALYMRICRRCQKNKSLESFGWDSMKKYRRRICYSCVETAKRVVNPERMAEKDQARLIKASETRATNPTGAILTDTRSSDRKRGWPGNDLTLDAVSKLIEHGCCYCGETGIRMTLDRKDNALAHNLTNVIPACIRCNYLRGSMPYEAWVHIVPVIRETRILGLFGEWRSRPFNKKRR